MDSKNLRLLADLTTVQVELLTLSPRLTEAYGRNALAAAELVGLAIETVKHEAGRKAITCLTFDAEAGMAYLHFLPPGTAAAVKQLSHVFIKPTFTATTDYGADFSRLGTEFPARSQEEALARAAIVAASFA